MKSVRTSLLFVLALTLSGCSWSGRFLVYNFTSADLIITYTFNTRDRSFKDLLTSEPSVYHATWEKGKPDHTWDEIVPQPIASFGQLGTRIILPPNSVFDGGEVSGFVATEEDIREGFRRVERILLVRTDRSDSLSCDGQMLSAIVQTLGKYETGLVFK